MYVLGQCGLSLSLKLHVCFRSMWTPDVVFKNQVSIDGDEDAIKNESDGGDTDVIDLDEKKIAGWGKQLEHFWHSVGSN